MPWRDPTQWYCLRKIIHFSSLIAVLLERHHLKIHQAVFSRLTSVLACWSQSSITNSPILAVLPFLLTKTPSMSLRLIKIECYASYATLPVSIIQAFSTNSQVDLDLLPSPFILNQVNFTSLVMILTIAAKTVLYLSFQKKENLRMNSSFQTIQR